MEEKPPPLRLMSPRKTRPSSEAESLPLDRPPITPSTVTDQSLAPHFPRSMVAAPALATSSSSNSAAV